MHEFCNNQVFSSCTYWAYAIPMCVYVYVYLSVYPSTIRKCLFSIIPWWIFMILGYNHHQVGGGGGNNRGVQEFGIKGHLGVIWSCCLNMLKMLFRLHNSINFDETWVKRSFAWGSFGVFRNFWLDVRGQLVSTWDQIFKILQFGSN